MICPRPLTANPLVVALVYLTGAGLLSLVFAAVARLVDPYLCPVVLFATLFAIGVIGAIQLAGEGSLNKPYVELMRIFYKGLPYLLWRKVREGTVVAENNAAGTEPQAAPQ